MESALLALPDRQVLMGWTGWMECLGSMALIMPTSLSRRRACDSGATYAMSQYRGCLAVLG